MKKIILSLLMLITPLLTYAEEEEVLITSLTTYVGEIKILEVGSVERVAVGNGSLLSTSILDNGQLLLISEGEGETTVHIWYTDGAESDLKVSILTKDSDRIVEELRTLLSDFPNLEVRRVGQKIFLTGSALKTEEDILNTIKEAYKEVIDISRKVAPRPTVVFPANKMVYMDVKITEFNISKLRQLGVDWSDAIAGPSVGLAYDAADNNTFRAAPDATLTPSFAGATFPANLRSGPLGYFGLVTEITSRIQILESTGDAVILAEPKLSSRSGGEAEFLAGGEIPIVTTGSLGSSNTEFKEFGIKLNIAPVVDDQSNIVAKVATEISAVDNSNAVGGVPAFITRRTATDIYMRDQETLVMSGLIDRDISKNIEKIPFLGDIPVLGHLFKSTDWNNNRSELVIFVTPTLYDASSELNTNALQRREELFGQFKENIDNEDLLLDDY